MRRASARIEPNRQPALDATMRAVPEPMMIVDSSDRVCVFNPAAERLTGCQAEEVLGHAYADVLRFGRGDTEGTDLLSQARKSHTLQGPAPVLWLVHSAEGECANIAATASPILEANGAFGGAVVILQELNRQIQMEYAKSGYLSLVSHELRSRLTSISASAELLLQLELDQAQSREILDVVRTQSRRLATFFDRLMDADVLESGQLRLQWQPVAVLPLIKTVVARFEAEATGHRFAITCGDSIQLAYADEEKTETVLYNLVENAMNHSPQGSEITIDVQANGTDELVLSVRDQGEGIPTDELEGIFQRFRRVGDGIERVPGHGLGLYIAKGFVEGQGGRIWAESTPGAGATFRFTLLKLKEDVAT